MRLARWSEGKTLTLFRQVYQRMAVLAREPIHQLYADIVRYLDAPAEPRAEPATAQQPSPPGPGRPGSSAEADSAWWLSSPPQGDTMTDSVNLFFARLFPLTFHTTVAPPKKVSKVRLPTGKKVFSLFQRKHKLKINQHLIK